MSLFPIPEDLHGTGQSNFSNEVTFVVLEPGAESVPPLPAKGPEDMEVPDLLGVEHTTRHDLRFEDYGYLECYFRSEQPGLSFLDVAVEVDGNPAGCAR